MKFKDEIKINEVYTPSRGYHVISENINYLDRLLDEKGPVAKGISKELGKGYIDDFKKMSKLMDEIAGIWQEIEFDVEHQ